MLDFLKKKELDKIALLLAQQEELTAQVKCLLDQNAELSELMANANLRIKTLEYELEEAKDDLEIYTPIIDLVGERNNLKSQIESLDSEKAELNVNICKLNEEYEEKQRQIIKLDEEILIQEFGLYQPVYDFATSEHYKERLAFIRLEQKNMILRGEAATCSNDWRMNGSLSEGRKMIEQGIKLIIRCFNDECDALIGKVKFSNVNTYLEKIYKSRDALNKLNTHNAIELSERYVDLKIEELKLAYEYEIKKQDEKEEAKRYREQLREEAKLLKEIEEARRDIEKEQKHYTNALIKINKQLESASDIDREALLEKKIEIENHLEKLDISLKDIDYREANKKAGYVYIISNIGSFGENIYKIGMTRRLDPFDRVDELGDASVPFKFDVHAMIFSDDAPKLEAALHRAFEHKKLNMVNQKREFFAVTLEEIEEVVKANYDKTVEFVKVAEAGQYRESIKMKLV